MWPDNETTNDLLGFRVHADLIRAVVTNPKMLPTTIGVFGDWGGGKTSIMRMLEEDLDPETWEEGSADREQLEGVAVVYVNTWLFEGYDDAKSALLTAVLNELIANKRFGPKLRDGALQLLKTVDWMRVARLGWAYVGMPAAAALMTGGLAAVPAAIAASASMGAIFSSKTKRTDDKAVTIEDSGEGGFLKDEQAEAEPLDIRTFRQRFKKLLDDAAIATLVVIVDDLDRCTPDRIIDNLEAVKLFLSVEQSAFVIGADRRIVEHAIRLRYAAKSLDSPSNSATTDQLVKDYLEKLVHIPYSLPRLSSSEIGTYMALLFCAAYHSEVGYKACLAACDTLRQSNRYASFGYSAVKQASGNMPLSDSLTSALELSAGAAPLIADGLKGNPRQVKRFLNALLLRKRLSEVARLTGIRDDVLVKLMILEYAHSDLFVQLFGWQSQQEGQPKEITKLESAVKNSAPDTELDSIAKGWSSSTVKKWLTMEPSLTDLDLRDYFWVARDRLESTFAGISMVPPIVRNVLNDLVSGNTVKRNAAMKTAKTLIADERETLFRLLESMVTRKPAEKTGYDAIRALTEADVSGAAELLAKVLTEQPSESVPPAVAMELATLIRSKKEIAQILTPAAERLSKTPTPAGRAIKESKTSK